MNLLMSRPTITSQKPTEAMPIRWNKCFFRVLFKIGYTEREEGESGSIGEWNF
jgi:hypothetical protein